MTAFGTWTERNGPGNGTDPDLKRPKAESLFPSKGSGGTPEAGRWKKPGQHKRKRMRGWISGSRPAASKAFGRTRLQPPERKRESPRRSEGGRAGTGACFGQRLDRAGSGVRPAKGPAGEGGFRPAGAGGEDRSLLRSDAVRRNRGSLLRRRSRSGRRQRFASRCSRRTIEACFGRMPKGRGPEFASIRGRKVDGWSSLRSDAAGEGGGVRPDAGAERNRPGSFGSRLEPPETGRAPATAGDRKGSRPGRKAWCETPKGNRPRASGVGSRPGNGTRLASAATRPTQREPPRDPAAAVAGTVGAGGNASPHLLSSQCVLRLPPSRRLAKAASSSIRTKAARTKAGRHSQPHCRAPRRGGHCSPG
jgi:hypothetical protein